MGQFVPELKTSNTAGQSGEDTKDIKNTVRNAVRDYAETVKQWDQDTEKHIVEAKGLSRLFTEPDQAVTNKDTLAALIFALAVTLAAAGAMGFLFTREAALRRQTAVQLELVRDEQGRLEQSVAKLTSEAEVRQGQIQKLTKELEEAGQKTAQFDQLRAVQEAEMIRIKNFYEVQITALKGIVRMRDQWAQNFQAQLEAIKRILERGAVSASVGAAVPEVAASVQSPSASMFNPNLASVPEGRVLAVDYVNRFLVTDLGPDNGAQAGKIIQIYRDREHLGQARIDRTYQDLSAATIINDDLLERVEEGDKAFLSSV